MNFGVVEGRIRARVVWIALGGVVPMALFVQWSDLLVGGTMTSGPFPPLAACLLWGLLLLVQAGVARGRSGRGLFTSGELLVILAVWIVANMVAGRGLLHPMLCSLVGPTYYARSGAVANAVAQNLPDWLAVTDKAAARAFYEGQGMPVPWTLWARPLLTWTLFFVPFLLANVCLCALFERIWVRHERLAYPMVALPIEAVGGRTSAAGNAPALSSRQPFYVGLAIPLLLHGFGVANAYAPGVPCLPFFNDLSSSLTELPWSALKPLYVNLYPLFIGLIFLAPTDVTFGIWFFLLLNKLELVTVAMAGWNEGSVASTATSSFPYIEEQSAGAFLALGALLVWNARRHLRQVWSGEQRLLAWGFALGLGGTLAWCVVTGLPLWFAAAFFGFYLLVALVLSRLMAEGGVPWTLAPMLPDKLILSLVGSDALSPVALSRLMLHVQHLRDARQLPAPAIFSAGRLRDEAGVSLRGFYGLLMAAMLLALAVGVASALPLCYRYGALSLTPRSDGLLMSAVVIPTTAVGQTSARLLSPTLPNSGAALAVTFGAALTWLLSALRVRLLWWPLHPLGYALTGTMQQGYANKMLFSVFLGWALKTLALRFGGAQGFRLLRGAALGLILGDLMMGGILKLLDALLGPSGYAIF